MPDSQVELVNLQPGARIEAPGFYKVEIDRYHSPDLCNGPSISSGGLRTIDLSCPAEYWARSPYNPDRIEREETDALRFGRAAHALLLGDEIFSERYAVEPDMDALGPDGVFRAKDEIVDWLKARGSRATGTVKELMARAREHGCEIPHKDELTARFRETLGDRTPISAAAYRHIEGMAEALHRHPMIRAGLLDGIVEPTMIWRERGVWVKSRPDILPVSGTVADLKTIHDASPAACLREIRVKGYDMQMALAAQAMAALSNIRISAAAIFFVQKSPPYHCVAVEIEPEALYWAACRNRRAVEAFAHGMETGEWPAHPDTVFTAFPSAAERWKAEQDAGLLPALSADEAGLAA